MLELTLKRLMSLPLVLIGVTFAMQLLYLLLPGDPAVTLAGGENASISDVERIRQELHLDDSVFVQYWNWLSRAIQLDFGTSIITGQPVAHELLTRVPVTFGLGLAAFAIALPLGLALGVIAAVYRGRPVDRFLLAVTSASMAVPGFVIAILLIVVFAVQLRLVPAMGYIAITENPPDWLRHIIMPAFAIAVAPAARVARTLRSSLIGSLDSPYVLTAWSKGGAPGVILGRHALKNSLVPTVTVLGLQVDLLIGGSLVVESIFAVPGVGAYVAGAATSADLPVIQASTLVFAVATVLANLVVDIAYGLLNPKVRVSS